MKKKLAKLTSDLLNPFLISFIVLVLLSFRSTSTVSEALKWLLISVVFSVLPVFVFVLYLVRRGKLDGIFTNTRHQRHRIYLLASACAVAGSLLLTALGAPLLLRATFVAGLAAIITFMAINFIWKISLHTAFTAASVAVLCIVYGAVGALTALLLPPVAWARIELDSHSPAQVATGAVLAGGIVLFVFFLFGLTGARA